MTTSDAVARPPKKGDVFRTPDGTTIHVRRASKDAYWCDVRVVQRGGASWRKRQPLVNGFFAYEVERITP